MPKHRTQRVGIFVDVQNLYYSAKQFYNSKVNFAYILNKAIAGRELVRAIAYVIRADIKDEHNFFDALEKIGFDVRSKDLQTFYTGAKKGDWDVGIAMDIMRMASKLDVVVLVSGDGDFKDLLEHVKALGCRAEVVSFAKTTSSRLTEVADEVLDLGKDLDKVLIKDHRHPRPEMKTELPPQTDGPVEDKAVLPTEVLLNEGVVEKQKEFQKQPFQRPPFKKPFQRPFQKQPFQKQPFQRPPFKRFDRGDRGDGDRRDNDTNILQKINMDQPLFSSKPAHAEPPRIGPQEKAAPRHEAVIEKPKEHEPKAAAVDKEIKKPKVLRKKKIVKEPRAHAEKQTEEQRKESFVEKVFGKRKKIE